MFQGVGDHGYRFYSVARDNAGNVEIAPDVPDATTYVALCVDTLRIAPNPVAGSLPATGTVTLTAPAPSGGAVVTLASSNPAVASVPATITVAEGTTTQTFTVNTAAVTATKSVTISATWNGVKKTATLRVRPVAISTLTFDATTVRSGGTRTGTVTLEAPAAPGSITVALTSSSSLLTVPASITVQAGSTTGTFTAQAGTAALSTSVTVKATAGGVTKSAAVKVLANGVASLAISPTTVKGGADATATIKLDAIATVNSTVTISSSAATVAKFVDSGGNPISSVSIPAGQQTATVSVRTSPVIANKSVTLKAIASGLYKTAVLAVTP